MIARYGDGTSFPVDTNSQITWTSGAAYSTYFYIYWSPSISSGYFLLNSSTYYYRNYSSGFYDGIRKGVIGRSAFLNGEFTYLQIDGCCVLGSQAFSGCQSLSYAIMSDCVEVGDYAFWACHSLSYVELLNCNKIGTGAFELCDNSLLSFSLPVCKEIGSRAFAGCTGLFSISLPEIGYIPDCCFLNCYNLNNVHIGGGGCGISAFAGCRALRELTFYHYQYFDSYVFSDCRCLSKLTFYGSYVASVARWDLLKDTPFKYVTSSGHSGSIFVPSSMLSDWKSDSFWGYYSSIIYPMSE